VSAVVGAGALAGAAAGCGGGEPGGDDGGGRQRGPYMGGGSAEDVHAGAAWPISPHFAHGCDIARATAARAGVRVGASRAGAGATRRVKGSLERWCGFMA